MALDLGIFLEGAQSTFKVKVSENDQQAQYLIDKLVSSDGSVTITETNDGGVETIDLTSSSSSPLRAKGDLYTFDSGDAKLPVGTDGQVLLADSAEVTGLRWGTVSADNMATADLTLTGDRSHDFNGNDLIFQTGQNNRFRIWNGIGNINNGLAFWDAGSAYMNTSFYTWNLLANNGTRSAVRFLFNGETSFGYDVRFSSSSGNYPAANTRVHITGGTATSSSTALLVENSSATQLLKIDDSGGFALGKNANYEPDPSCVTIGQDANTNRSGGGSGAVAIGDAATAIGVGSAGSNIAIGKSSKSIGENTIAIGFQAGNSVTSGGNSAILIGNNTATGVTTLGTETILIGDGATGTTIQGLGIGTDVTVNGNFGLALGRQTTVNNTSGIALGHRVTSSATRAYIIGNGTGYRTNSTNDSFEVNFNETTSTFRFGKSVDGWLNSTGNFAIGSSTPNSKLDVAGDIAITDGMTAPSATVGKAKIYVDTADGDLKIVFGDGTVKTIVTDS